MDSAPAGSDENSSFDKIAGRPLLHVPVLRDTCTSVCIAILDARQRGPEGVPGRDARHNLFRRTILKLIYASDLQGFFNVTSKLLFSQVWPIAIIAMQKKVSESLGDSFRYIEDNYLRGPWVMGEHYTIADPYLFTLAQWMEADGVELSPIHRVVEHRSRMSERRSVQTAIAAELE